MNAKDYLSQYRLMKARTEDAEAILEELRADRESIPIHLDRLPHSSHAADRTGELAAKIVDVESKILSMKSEAYSIVLEITSTLFKLEDPQHERLLRMRYINGYTWERIAEEMHYSYQWVAGPLHDHALKEIEKLIN